MGLKVRVRGVDRYVRDLAKIDYKTFDAARDGVIEAAEYLLEVVKEKIGVYQPGWAKLKYNTIKKKLSRYGVGDKPLLASGAMRDSFKVVKGGKGRLSASVGSDSSYLVHHVYGAPGANVPKRDPIRVTAVEEMDMCHQIIEEKIMEVIDGWW